MANTIAAIDFGTSKIALAQARVDSSGTWKVTGSAAVGYAGFHDGVWLDFDAMEEAVARVQYDCARQGGKMARNFIVGVPGEFIHIEIERVSIPIGGLVQAYHYNELLSLPQHNANPSRAVTLHRQPLVFETDGQFRSTFPQGERVGELGACVALTVSQKNFHDSVEEALGEMGVGIAGYIASPVAQAYALVEAEHITGDALLIDAGHLSLDITCANPRGIFYHVNLDAGGADITADIATALNMDFYDAEALKRRQGTEALTELITIGNASYTLQDIMDSRVRSIVRTVQNTLLSAAIAWEEMESIWLLGGGIGNIRGGREIMSATFDRNVKIQPGMSPLISGNTCNTAMSILIYYMQYAQLIRGEGWLAKLKRKINT